MKINKEPLKLSGKVIKELIMEINMEIMTEDNFEHPDIHHFSLKSSYNSTWKSIQSWK